MNAEFWHSAILPLAVEECDGLRRSRDEADQRRSGDLKGFGGFRDLELARCNLIECFGEDGGEVFVRLADIDLAANSPAAP